MTYILYNIEKKLKKSVFNEKNYSACLSKIDVCHVALDNSLIYLKKEKKISLIVKRMFLKFLIFFSKQLRNKKKNIKNLLLFFKFYKYFNTFFFNNKLFFYKKYFSKKNYNLFYLKNFFLNTKQIRLKLCLHRLKAKRISFYKKYI